MTGQKNFASKQGNILTLAYYEKTRKFPGIRPDNNFCRLLTSTLSSVLASAFNFAPMWWNFNFAPMWWNFSESRVSVFPPCQSPNFSVAAAP